MGIDAAIALMSTGSCPILYYCTARHAYALGIFIAFCGPRSGARIRIVPFRGLSALPMLDPGIHIFTDLDRVSGPVAEGLPQLADMLERNGNVVLNHPGRALARLALLEALHDRGINGFAAYPLAAWSRVKRFPVFIRRAAGHQGALTGLIADVDVLAREAGGLIAAHGEDPDLIVVEYCDARDATGRHRKYSAFRVGDHDYAAFADSSDDWQVRFAPPATEEERADWIAFTRTHPHRSQLDRVWDIAGIGYGRVDYGIVDGRVQVFEINTNPTIVESPATSRPHERLLAAMHDKALCRLKGPEGAAAVRNPLFRDDRPPLDALGMSKAVLRWGRRHWPNRWRAKPPALSRVQASPCR